MKGAVLLFRRSPFDNDSLKLLLKEAVESAAETTLVCSDQSEDIHGVPRDVLDVVMRLLGGPVESGYMQGDDGEMWWLDRGDLTCCMVLGSAYKTAVDNGLWDMKTAKETT